jgi:hypothetical protein
MTLKSNKLFKIFLLLSPLWAATVAGLESCQWTDPVLKTLKNCTLPTDINIVTDAVDPKKYTFSLASTTTDVKTVTWKVLSGSTVLVQSTLTSAQSYAYTASTNGSYTVSAEIETVCGEKKTLSKAITIKTCVQPTAIATTSVSNNTYTYSLTTTTPADVKTVTWKVLSGTTSLVQEQRTNAGSFNYTFASSGSYTISAEIETICGEKVTRTLVATISVSVATQAPTKIWDKTFGGSSNDNLKTIIATSDGGFLLGGSSVSSISGEKSEINKGKSDYWVVKINSNGQKIWDRTYGGNDEDILNDLVPTSDGGFLLVGESSSNISGDKSENSKGMQDYWVIKINSNGQKVWDKTYGGSQTDICTKIILTTDGNFLLGGYSFWKASGDKSEDGRGYSDYWVLKINNSGQKIWDRTFGGSEMDELRTMSATTDGGFVIAGSSSSGIANDKFENSRGNFDYWVVKINANGQKMWDRTFGGADFDFLTDIKSTDNGFILGGYSRSNNSGDKTENSRGNLDYWVVKINAESQKIWDKTLGGNLFDVGGSVAVTQDGDCLICGGSSSNISGDKSDNSKGNDDYWIIKINSNGQKIWDKPFGGSNIDSASTIVGTTDGGFVIAGISYSNISGDKSENSRGGSDYWVVKVK